MLARHEEYGLGALICARQRRDREIGDFHAWVMPALRHNQIMFVFDKGGDPLGYWSWAHVAPDVEERFMASERSVLHESEWNEGGALWVMELVAPNGFVSDIVSFIRRSANHGQKTIKVRRSSQVGRMRPYSIWSAKPFDDYDEWAQASRMYRLPRSSFATSYSAWLADETRPSIAF